MARSKGNLESQRAQHVPPLNRQTDGPSQLEDKFLVQQTVIDQWQSKSQRSFEDRRRRWATGKSTKEGGGRFIDVTVGVRYQQETMEKPVVAAFAEEPCQCAQMALSKYTG